MKTKQGASDSLAFLACLFPIIKKTIPLTNPASKGVVPRCSFRKPLLFRPHQIHSSLMFLHHCLQYCQRPSPNFAPLSTCVELILMRPQAMAAMTRPRKEWRRLGLTRASTPACCPEQLCHSPCSDCATKDHAQVDVADPSDPCTVHWHHWRRKRPVH